MNLEKTIKIGDALSNPVRIKIIHLLNKKPMNIYELAKTLNLSRPVIYTHLKKLEEADLVESDLILDDARAKRIYKSKEFKFCIDNDKIDEFFE
ncbi:winged helix-turn-helix domain-containing protein [Methanothermococcus sp. Ax23]|jgi:DNA-binding transcriptional ArsR family regulator|uniref:ArsR/SmtB family transcription factor n=1 Tax=Methanothermococcus sp. Ax23 TaxID=3156486 RepID=UPI003B9E96E3